MKRLAYFKAAAAFPVAADQFLFTDDLSRRPITLKPVTAKELPPSVWWIDDSPASVKSLVDHLNLSFVPKHVAIYYPDELYEELLQKELHYHNLPEDQIEKTIFRVTTKGDGYEFVVEDQKKRP